MTYIWEVLPKWQLLLVLSLLFSVIKEEHIELMRFVDFKVAPS